MEDNNKPKIRLREIQEDGTKQFTQVIGFLYSQDKLPGLDSAAQAATYTGISKERLLQLASDGLCPCLRLDNGEPLFYKKDICEWVKENLVEVQPGIKLTQPVVLLRDRGRPANFIDLPECLSPMAKHIQQVSTGETPCVYFLVCNGEVVYIGQSVNLGARLNTHRRDKAYDKVFYINLPRESLNEVESALIKAIQPKLNEQMYGYSANPEVLKKYFDLEYDYEFKPKTLIE